MERKTLIAKAREAVARVEKAMSYKQAAGIAIGKTIERLQKLQGELGDGEMTSEQWTTLMDSCRKARATLESVLWSDPMVPAEDVAKAAKDAPTMEEDAVVEHVIAELEKAAKEEPLAAAARVRFVKMTLYAWEEVPEGVSLIPVLKLPGAGDTVVVKNDATATPPTAAVPAAAVSTTAAFRWPATIRAVGDVGKGR